MLSGEKARLSIGILGGTRSSIHPKLIINLITFPGRKQRDQQFGSILSKVLISGMVPPRLSARHVRRYLPTLSFGLVVVVHLLFGTILGIRNVVAQKVIRYLYCNLKL